MNPDANMQDQTTDQNDPIMDNKYIVEAAQQILSDEQAAPGSQDPAAIEWAKAKANLPVGTDPSASAPASPPDTLQVQHTPDEQPAAVPQPPAQNASAEAASSDGHTLYIDRSEASAPAGPETNQPNGGQGQQQ